MEQKELPQKEFRFLPQVQTLIACFARYCTTFPAKLLCHYSVLLGLIVTDGGIYETIFVFSVALFLVALTISGIAQTNQLRGKQRHRGEKFFKKLDKNNDYQISHAEWTRKPQVFDRIDQNHDGILYGRRIEKQADASLTLRPAKTQ